MRDSYARQNSIQNSNATLGSVYARDADLFVGSLVFSIEKKRKRGQEKARAGKIRRKRKRKKKRGKRNSRAARRRNFRRARGRCLKSSSARLTLPVFVCPSRERECCSAVGIGARARAF